jgi:hypothetical protein
VNGEVIWPNATDDALHMACIREASLCK